MRVLNHSIRKPWGHDGDTPTRVMYAELAYVPESTVDARADRFKFF